MKKEEKGDILRAMLDTYLERFQPDVEEEARVCTFIDKLIDKI